MSDRISGAYVKIENRVPLNVPGKFFVDDQCLDCDLCRETAPNNFSRDAEHGVAYVAKQPATPEELALCRESVEGCPCQAIGDTGDQQDWEELPPAKWLSTPPGSPKVCKCKMKKPWWRFW